MQMIIGELSQITRYPVKSMAGENLTTAFISYAGLTGDRVYAFVDQAKKNNFPWLTGRQYPNLLQYRPAFLQAPPIDLQFPDQQHFHLAVTTPEGLVWQIDDWELKQELEDKSSRPLQLRFSEKGMHDSRPISIISQQTIRHLASEIDTALDPRRFRMNFQVNWSNERPFQEDELLGRKIQIGDTLQLEINKKDGRCVMITFDPDTSSSNSQILRYVAEKLGGCLGVYAVVIREGKVKEGDNITLL